MLGSLDIQPCLIFDGTENGRPHMKIKTGAQHSRVSSCDPMLVQMTLVGRVRPEAHAAGKPER